MRKFMLSTAILAGLSGVALAQDAAATGMFRTAADAMELRASTFIGMRDRKSTRLNSSHLDLSRMPSSA